MACSILRYMYCKEEKPTLAIRLPEGIEERLNALAKETGRTKTFYVREAILVYLDDIEDIYLAEKRLADIRAGRNKPIPAQNGHRNRIKDQHEEQWSTCLGK